MKNKNFSFLVIDDLQEDIDLLCECVLVLGQKVDKAFSMLDAIEKLSLAQINEKQYDFILADYKLGENRDGMLLLAFAKKVYPQILRIIVSNYIPCISIIKPVKGRDEDDYENFKSICIQNYKNDYEILFCVEGTTDPVIPIIERIINEFPEQKIKLINSDLYGTGKGKIKNIIAGVKASRYDVLVFSDADVHISPLFLQDFI